MRDVEDQFGRAIASYRANPNLVIEHANHEESIRTGGYANRTLLELVQNAADAMAGGGDSSGRVEIVLDPERSTLYCANAGRPFSKSGLTAIEHAHLSAKRGDEIGRFGLGFKSVLAVTRAPQVFSRSVSFEFNSPRASAALVDVGSGAKRYPILRTATLIDPDEHFAIDPVLADLSQWAATIVKLPNAVNLEQLRREIETFASEFLLFVRSVREIRLRVLGAGGFETSHVSRDLGNGLLKIERPDGSGEEWIIEDKMHAPSKAARQLVGEAVSRNKVKVTVAVPVRHSQRRVGRFWSYFPLQDETSASALFNAPWSVNDDRTTLLRNEYNREILGTLAEVFIGLLSRIPTSEDPAAHLDYLPARGREERSFGDSVLCSAVPRLSESMALIPDACGAFQHCGSLRPLDLTVPQKDLWHKQWSESPNTGSDVPHWRCYSSPQRVARLRSLLVRGVGEAILDEDTRDAKRALEAMPKRGLLSWLREWAEGDDIKSTLAAFKFIVEHRNIPGIVHAKVIPTTDGMKSLDDKSMVFLEREEDLEIDGAEFVAPAFLAQPGVQKILQEAGFRKLDPEAILTARVEQLSESASDDELTRLWDAVLNVSVPVAVRVLTAHRRHVIKVPTCDGGWAWPLQTFDIDQLLAHHYPECSLDRSRCMPDVAHALGVVQTPVKKYSFDDEPFKDEYEKWVLEVVNQILGAGERPVERMSLYPKSGHSPGPFSMLMMLEEAEVSEAVRTKWTCDLLSLSDAVWDCEDIDSGVTYEVTSPVHWAADRAGLVRSSLGYRRPSGVVAPSLVQYKAILPLFEGARDLVDKLELADELESVPESILAEGLATSLLPPTISDRLLGEFIVVASSIAYPEGYPPAVPAHVGRGFESRSPKSVFIAVNGEQRSFLAGRHRPYLMADEELAEQLIDTVGCQRFEDTFEFSMHCDGQQATERVLDVFTGLRSTFAEELSAATVTRAIQIIKRVTTADGVEDQSLDWHLSGSDLFVQSEFEERALLETLNEAFELRMNNADLERVRQAGIDHRLESLRQRAQAADGDVERIDIYIGEDDLRDALPSGLWKALEAQGLVDQATSVAKLCLTVYGSDTIERLAGAFRREGFPDVPTEWAGRGPTISWLRKMGFGPEFAGRPNRREEAEFIVPGATRLTSLHEFQRTIRVQLRDVLTRKDEKGRCYKAMVELPTGSGKTRVATQTVLELFRDDEMRGTILWIAQSQELCEQAVQTWSTVWRGLKDERPLTICRLWGSNEIHEPDTEFSVVVATDAQLDEAITRPEYQWLSEPAAVIIDEGHRAGDSERYTRILDWLGVAGHGYARPLVGLSATPFKGNSDHASARLASRFGNRILRAFDYDAYRKLADIGILARVQHEVLPTGHTVVMDDAEKKHATKFKAIRPSVLDKIGQDHKRMAILVEHILGTEHKQGTVADGSVLVFMPSVLSAQVLAAILSYRGITAESVSGDTGRQRRREVIQQFKEGKIDVLTNCDLLVQGFDAPGVRTLYIARPTFSPNAYIQMAGRGLRGPANQGSALCRIVDLEDNFGDNNDFLGFRKYADLWEEHRL